MAQLGHLHPCDLRVSPETSGSQRAQVCPGAVDGVQLAEPRTGLAAVNGPVRTSSIRCRAVGMSRSTLTRKGVRGAGGRPMSQQDPGADAEQGPGVFGSHAKADVNSAGCRWMRRGRRGELDPSRSEPHGGDVGTRRRSGEDGEAGSETGPREFPGGQTLSPCDEQEK